MSSFDLVINGKTVKANYGETLVDAGLAGWVAIPHDCCSGQCETCRVTVVSGQVDDRGTADKRTVLACQAKVIGNAAIDPISGSVPHRAYLCQIRRLD